MLILDEPTRGIDVGAKAEIQSLIDELAGQGLSVLMISSEIEELMEGADRVTVMRDGRSTVTMAHGEVSQDRLLGAMAQSAQEETSDPASGVAPAQETRISGGMEGTARDQ